MDDNFSPRVRDVITFSKEEALRLGHDFIGTEHLLLGLIRKGEGKAIDILNAFDVDLELMRKKIEKLNPAATSFTDAGREKKPALNKASRKSIKNYFFRSKTVSK